MDALLIIVALLFSIVVHEVAHAWQARREGDDTAEQLGRITLNPLPHLDLFGSILVPAMLYLSNAGFLFGWAKPVPVDPSRYRDYVAGDIRVSLAGIVSNLALAVISTVLLAVLLVLRTTLAGTCWRTCCPPAPPWRTESSPGTGSWL
jgi:Zn-dependent protease